MTSLIPLTDTHCHLNLNQFDNDLEEVLERALASGVERILVPGLDVDTSRQAVQLANKYPNLFAAVGVHPNSANTCNSASMNEIKDLCQHPKVRAIGEIGLDYYRRHTTPEEQKELFLAQLEIAAEVNLPVVIHNRQSFQDMLPILKNWRAKLRTSNQGLAERPGVLHAFEGTIEVAAEIVAEGFLLGIGGPVTYSRTTPYPQIISAIAPEHLLIETDSPYQTPHPFRGSRNEPANVRLVVEKIAEIMNLEYEEVARSTSLGADRLFLWRATL